MKNLCLIFEEVIKRFSPPQMEELLDTRGSVYSHDFRLFSHHLYGTCHAYISGE